MLALSTAQGIPDTTRTEAHADLLHEDKKEAIGPHAFWLCKFSRNYAFLTKTRKRMFLRLLNFPLSLICLQPPLLFHLTFPLEKSNGSMGSFHLIQTIKIRPARNTNSSVWPVNSNQSSFQHHVFAVQFHDWNKATLSLQTLSWERAK